MADPFLGEIRIMPYTYAPYGWAWCDGQVIPIVQNTALYAILGTTFGGDGRTTFGLPNLHNRVPIGFGAGPGLTNRVLGATGGVTSVTLTAAQTPAHTHALMGKPPMPPAGGTPVNAIPGGGGMKPYKATGSKVPLGTTGTLEPVGKGEAHPNTMPTTWMNYCIATMGIFPPRQ